MRKPLAVLVLSLSLLSFAPAAHGAGLTPYVRLGYGGGELRMTDLDGAILRTRDALVDAGIPADFHKVGSAYGPAAAAGLWVLPNVRVGATYAYHHASLENGVAATSPLVFVYDDAMNFRVREFGAEAAVRFPKWAGLTVGAGVAAARAQFDETSAVGDSLLRGALRGTATRTKLVYDVHAGFDQTNEQGLAGFVRAGWAFRDLGHMDGAADVYDGLAWSRAAITTRWLDFSGPYVVAGIGWDMPR